MPDSFSYTFDENNISVSKLQFVKVDFNNKKVIGIVQSTKKEPHLPSHTKAILDVYPYLLPDFYLKLAHYIKDICFVSLSTALHSILPSSFSEKNISLFEKYANLHLPKKHIPTPLLIHYSTTRNKYRLIIDQINYHLKDEEQLLYLLPSKNTAETAFDVLSKKNFNVYLWQNRKKDWKYVIEEKPQIILGSRSAVFAPFSNLKMIIMEDEHSSNYKSEQTPKYNTFDLVCFLTEIFNARLILSSFAPSIEAKIKIKNTYQEKTKKADIEIIDMKMEKEKGNYTMFSDILLENIQESTPTSKTFIFLNRKGYSRAVLCRDCGWEAVCPNCSVNLIYHTSNYLICHWCRYREELPPLCPVCNSPDIKLSGKGTQKVEIEIKKKFRQMHIIRIDKDNPTCSNYQKANIIIGTEYAFDKINWQDVGVIGVIDGDFYKYIPNFKSVEEAYVIFKFFSLKVLENKTKLIIQSHDPTTPLIKAIKEKKDNIYYKSEIKLRQSLHYPPFAIVIKLSYKHKNEKKAIGEAMHIYHRLVKYIIKENKLEKSIDISKPYPAHPKKSGGKYIFHIAVKIISHREKILPIIREKVPPDWTIDNNPTTLL